MFFKFIHTATTGVVETFGRFSKLAKPGLNFYFPIVQRIVPVSNRLQHAEYKMKVKTSDDVLPYIHVSAQFRIKPEDTYTAYYEMNDPDEQIQARFENALRSKVPNMTFEELYASHTELSEHVFKVVGEKMKDFGFTVESVQVRHIAPPREVEDAMNRVRASERNLQAEKLEGEAVKARMILEGEADAEKKALQGKGIADMRKNIMDGWTESVNTMAKAWGVEPKDTVNFILDSMHLETMNDMSKHGNSKVIFTDHNKRGDGLISSLEAHK